MRVSREVLQNFGRGVAPAAAPIEPLLCAADEAWLIANDDGSDPTVSARRARVLAIIRRPAPPAPADAELLVLLAAARALPSLDGSDRLRARQRLAEVGRFDDPPPEVAHLQRRLGIAPGDAEALADALLPPRQDIGPFQQTSYIGPY